MQRAFGMKNDTVPGGADYDTIKANTPVIPDADTFWPVTGGNFDPGLTRIDRNAEVRGRRANTSPISFRSDPTITVPVATYRTIVERALYKVLGQKATTGGTAPTPYTHTFTPVGFGNINLPAAHIQLVRDDSNIKMSGATWNRVTMNFPLDAEGTMEMELYGKFFDQFVTAPPTPSYTGMSLNPFVLRDASMFIDGASTAIQDLQGFSFTYANNLIRKPYAGRNIASRTVGTPTLTHKLWFPTENKAQAAPDVAFSMTFGSASNLHDIAYWYSQSQKLVFECVGDPLSGGYSASTELLRITLNSAVHTGGGSGDLTARDDITSTFDGGVFYSEADAGDVKIEVVSDTAGGSIL
jgi:hypothetical protein